METKEEFISFKRLLRHSTYALQLENCPSFGGGHVMIAFPCTICVSLVDCGIGNESSLNSSFGWGNLVWRHTGDFSEKNALICAVITLVLGVFLIFLSFFFLHLQALLETKCVTEVLTQLDEQRKRGHTLTQADVVSSFLSKRPELHVRCKPKHKHLWTAVT